MSDPTGRRALVIGGGITGMSAALLLSRSGMDVTLIEKHPRLAPLLRGFWRQGVHFETGFHFAGGLDRTGLLRTWLHALGLDLPYDSLLPETETVCVGERRFTMPCGHAEILRQTFSRFRAGHGKAPPGADRSAGEISLHVALPDTKKTDVRL